MRTLCRCGSRGKIACCRAGFVTAGGDIEPHRLQTRTKWRWIVGVLLLEVLLLVQLMLFGAGCDVGVLFGGDVDNAGRQSGICGIR